MMTKKQRIVWGRVLAGIAIAMAGAGVAEAEFTAVLDDDPDVLYSRGGDPIPGSVTGVYTVSGYAGAGGGPNSWDNTQDYDSDDTGSGVATWTFTGLPSRTYNVYASWVNGGQSNVSLADFTVSDGGGTVTIDQELTAPNDLYLNDNRPVSIGFERLGAVVVTDGGLTVELRDGGTRSGDTNGSYIVADAIAVEETPGTIAFDYNDISNNGGGVYAAGVGQEFTTGASPLRVDALGTAMWISDWSGGSSANLDNQDIRVKMWRVSDQAQLADVSLKSNDYVRDFHPSPDTYTFRYLREDVTGLTLAANTTYAVALYGTTNTGGALQFIDNLHSAANKVTIDANIAFDDSVYTPSGNPGGFPSSHDSLSFPRRGGPTFEFTVIPEPSTFALAAFGLLGLAGWRWRRK